MKAILVIDIPDDVAEDYKNFTVDYDLMGEDEDGDIVSIRYVYDGPLKPMPKKESEKHREEIEDWTGLAYSQGWNDCVEELEK